MPEKSRELLAKFNTIWKENNDIYRQLAKGFHMSDAAFWILYSLREQNMPLTQSELCSMLYEPKQTIHSSLKKLEEGGYIKRMSGKDHRSKKIALTEKGESLARYTTDLVMVEEQNALMELSEQEQVQFIELFRKYTNLLGQKTRALPKQKKD